MLLALDTATRMISVALHDGHRVRYEATWHSANNHTIELTPALQHALTVNDLQPGDLRGVAVAQGPGSFTGLRIGMSVAKGIVLAHPEIALVAVPTLEIVAAGAPHFDGALIAVLQAGRGRICAQRYTWTTARWTPDADAAIMTWAALLDTISVPTLIVGEINTQGREALAAATCPIHIAPGTSSLRRAGYLAERAWERLRTGHTADPHTVTPIYLHQPGVSGP
ncbi:MAG: tRNA (adenosine(37)-N6)-threonylcarbamoyltransferase complex dimerization subunit type 1 TsaB [Anaerolineae bacterium]|nr:tRNA (adenosine(37)-N6)-threonylcarbamoyltransferase complex dimerization subunit type 1 TsaB [Anaerolineae bacterium]